MATPHAKLGSIGNGFCPCHPPFPPVFYTTTIIQGQPTYLTNGMPTAIIGSIGISSCGHSTVAITGSSTHLSTGLGIHRLGDTGANCGNYSIVAGVSPNVISGG